MNDKMVRENLNYIDDIHVFDMDVSLLAPKIFDHLLQSDYPFINLE